MDMEYINKFIQMDSCHVLYHIIIVSSSLKISLKIDKNADYFL